MSLYLLEIELEKSLNLSIQKLINKCDENSQPIAKKSKKKELSKLEQVVYLFKLLSQNYKKYSLKWNFSNLIEYLNDSDANVKWFTIQIVSLLLSLKPNETKILCDVYLKKKELQNCLLNFQSFVLNDEYLPSKKYSKLNQLSIDLNMFDSFNENELFYSKNNSLVFVDSCRENIKLLFSSLQSNVSVFIEGDLGIGKTALVEHVAQVANLKLIKYQMDDYMDSKALIGSYVCSDVPGEFVWKPGPLCQALTNGCWLLLEDFDYSTVDSISLLINVLETNSLKFNEKTIRSHQNFRLILTKRTHKITKSSSNVNYISSLLRLSRCLKFKELSKDEIISIIFNKFKNLDKIAEKLYDLFKSIDFNQLNCDAKVKLSLAKDARILSLRDLLKVCHRLNGIDNYQDISRVYMLINDIMDCFVSFVSNKNTRLELAIAIGAKFNFNRDEIISFVSNYKPALLVKDSSFTCGRVTLKRETNEIVKKTRDTFVYTRVSLILIEKLARCIECNESILLCGETGVGKTSVLQYLAKILGQKLSVINLNQQTESGDLLGSFKPVDIKLQIKEIKDKFEELFERSFVTHKNETFLNHIQACYSKSNWSYLLTLMQHAISSAISKGFLVDEWKQLKCSVRKIVKNLDVMRNKFTFKFFEGALTQAICNGEWIILDEINLASSETLQFLGTLLEEKYSSIILHEKGDTEPLERHSNFRLFAAMNPASDIGKRNLPLSIRNRFTEIYVDELDEKNDLCLMVSEYLRILNPSNALVNSVVDFYVELKTDLIGALTNGIGYHPTYSLRTLCRALRHAAQNPCNNLLASVNDGLCLSFLTDLNRESSFKLENFIKKKLGKNLNTSSILRAKPSGLGDYVKIEGFWLLKGDAEKNQIENDKFIFTNSVKENLKRIARVCSSRLPCLLQGDTSIGKTSLIKWLANETHNTLIRINNHDHTDLQEYIGSYVIDGDGKLRFKEGLLVEAMRKGYWILLDELNLASSDVLEALNRVLDDNRELYIPEIQETVRAHPRFILFATQNPPGKYAGRKQLSRAFRNRFIELHFDEIPSDELSQIVEKKCKIPSSYSHLLVKTMTELQTHRSRAGIFAGKNSLITLRDLFRWATRYSKLDGVCFDDWKQYLAEQGFLLLSGSCRSQEDVDTIHECIQKVFKKKIDKTGLDYCKPIKSILNEFQIYCEKNFPSYVWTPNSYRLALHAGLAYYFNEPFLLVGDTGLGKTTICQMFAHYHSKYLHIVNCHMHSEAADFLGSIRPIRNQQTSNNDSNKLFEWQDGPLVTAIKCGQDFLIDEISLADDSVLERLNSLLESERSLLLAENSSSNASDVIYAHESFRLSATMNPSGDFGKKELSPALRNRFTEIWCPSVSNRDDYRLIIDELLLKTIENRVKLIDIISDFIQWIKSQSFFRQGVVSFRDLVTWIRFINAQFQKIGPQMSLIHGACLVFIDSFSIEANFNARDLCLGHLFNALGQEIKDEFESNLYNLTSNDYLLKCGLFEYEKAPCSSGTNTQFVKYSLNSLTTSFNVMRILRSLTMPNPIMLEGSPGVGKTSIVQALAQETHNKVVRINLSDQTDLSELFGSDLPSPDSSGKSQLFSWHDGPFLMALKEGSWIILDEINLASQSVLEGLNSCFDHRGEVYIAELDRKFEIKQERTKIFACQNPYKQGGGRKGLPKSFLNRFSKVYIDQMSSSDLFLIIKKQFDSIDDVLLSKMIEFNQRINQEVCVERKWGLNGSPWEFNLRDLMRWCELMMSDNAINAPGSYIYLIYGSRFRLDKDRQQVCNIYYQIFGHKPYTQGDTPMHIYYTQTHMQIGQSIYHFTSTFDSTKDFYPEQYQLTSSNMRQLEAILKCIQMSWMVVLVGQSCVGKTCLVRLLSRLCNHSLVEISVNNSTDTSDLLGGFSKSYLSSELIDLVDQIKSIFEAKIKSSLKEKSNFEELSRNIFELESIRALFEIESDTNDNDILKELLKKMENFIKQSNDDNLTKKYDDLFEKLNKNLTQDVKFEWIESSLVKAIKNGDWVLIDNANFCNPSVLDRLNPLLEQHGSLTITEKCSLNGQLETIRPHSGFRLFLAMNETFGEISRPMRNRGIEIYVSDIELFSTECTIYLKNMFEHECSIDLLNESLKNLNDHLSSKFQPSLTFKEAIKIAHMIKDYWQSGKRTFEESIKLAINELYPNFYCIFDKILVKNDDLYSIDAYKLTRFPFYQYLAQFPLHKEIVNLRCVDTSLVSQVKYTQFIKLWLQHIPLKHHKLLNEIIFNQNSNMRLREVYQEFFKNTKTFEVKLRAIEKQTKLSLTDSSYCIQNNFYLIQFLTSLAKASDINDAISISNALSGYLSLLLSQYRVNSSTSTIDSLLNLAESGAFDSLLSIGELNFTSVKLLDNFFRVYFECLHEKFMQIDGISLTLKDIFHLNLYFYSFERFRTLCASKFNQTLTFSYLKYYWNLLRHSIEGLQQMLNCFSSEFKTLFDHINGDFYFNDYWYIIFMKFWRVIKHSMDSCVCSNEDSSEKFKKLNNYLIENSFHVTNSSFKIERLIEYLMQHQDDQILGHSIDIITEKIDQNIEKISQERIKKWYLNDAHEFIKSLFIKNQCYPLKSYAELVFIHRNHTYKSSPSNALEFFSTNENALFTNIIQLFTRVSNSSYQKFKDFEEALIENSDVSLNNSDNIDEDFSNKQHEQKYGFGEILKRFKQKNLKMHEHVNVLQFDWLSGYLSELLCQATGQYVLCYYDEKMSQLEELITFLWSNYKLLITSSGSIEDSQLVECFSGALQKLKCEIFNESNENCFNEYLSQKGFDGKFLQYLSSEDDALKLICYGSLLAFTYLPMDPLDPSDYDCLAEKCNNEVKAIIEHEIDLKRRLSLVKCGQEIIDNSLNIEYINTLDTSTNEIVYRANQIDYFTLKKELENAFKQFASFKQLNKMVNNMKSIDKSSFKMINSEYSTWISSLNNFISKLIKNYHSYTDIIYMPIAGLSLIGYSMSVLHAKWLLKNQENSKNLSLIQNLFKYPVGDHLTQVKFLLQQAKSDSDNNELSDKLYYLALLNLYLSYHSNENDQFLIFDEICSYFSQRYQQELDIKIKESEIDAYKYKEYGQKEISSELDQIEYEQMFPSYMHDFKEFHFTTQQFENPNKNFSNRNSVKNETLTPQFLSQIFYLIECIIDRRAVPNVALKAFSNSYKMAERLVRADGLHLERNETTAYLSHIFYASLEKSGQNQDDFKFFKKYYNIYKDSNQSEVIRCKNVLREYKNRLNVLLNEWQDNSILLELGKICKRIESFHLNDSLIKYLTGLELLIQKSESWQLIASKANSLDCEIKLISTLIVEWRKLELNCWKESLELEAQNFELNCSFKWFSHVYSVCNEYRQKSSDLFELFKTFMESSPIGEYETRLKILQLCIQIFKLKQDECVVSMLWNVYKYFESYLEEIKSRITVKKNETEKELKEFVRICRWQDMNYWALKQSTDKSHKTLFKLIKKFKDFMITSVADYFIIQKYCLVIQTFESKYHEIVCSQLDYPYALKMKKFCDKLLKKKFSHPIFSSLDLLTSTIHDRFQSLAKQTRSILSVEKTKENKESFKKEMKNLQLQKRKSLSDLFKELSFIGLSYRRGNIELKQHINEIIHILATRPSSLNLVANKNEIENEFYSCVSRYMAYKQAQNTQQAQHDLKTLHIEQLDGYLHHLMFVTNNQKSRIHDAHEDLASLKLLNQTIEVIVKSKYMELNNYDKIKLIRGFIVKSNSLLDELMLFLDSSQNVLIETHKNDIKQLVDQIYSFLDEFYKIIVSVSDEDGLLAKIKANFITNELQENFEIIKNEFETHFGPCVDDLIEKNDNFYEIKCVFVSVKSHMNQAFGVLTTIKCTESLKESPVDAKNSKLIDKCLKNIEILYKKYFKNPKLTDNSDENHESLFDFEQKSFIDECFTNFEKDLQHLNLEKLGKQLKSQLLEHTDQDYTFTKATYHKIHSFLQIYYDFSYNWLQYLSGLHLKSCKLTNVLFYVFTEIRTKGFCTPKDFEMEEIDETNDDEKCENFSDDPKGLGEGQGAKDVSDQIETEDQLDDAKHKEDYDKQENEDDSEEMAEEKNGIEMSDDFDAKLNDKQPEEEDERNEGERDQEDDDQKEMDDQMGDVDDTANDVLDELLWGDEGEDEEESNKDKELEEDAKNGGEPDKSESELGAKQDELPMIDKGDNQSDQEEEQDEVSSENNNDDGQINDEEAKFLDDVEDKPENGSNETKDQLPINDENQNAQEQEEEEIKMETNENREESNEEQEETNDEHGDNPKIEEIIDESEEKNNENEDKIDQQTQQMEVDLLEEQKQDKKSNDMLADQQVMNEQQQEKSDNKQNNGENQQQQTLCEENYDSGNEAINNQSKPKGSQSKKKQKDKKKLGKTEEKRVMGNPDEEDNKKIDSLVDIDENSNDQTNDDDADQAQNDNQLDFRHIHNDNEKYDKQIRDAARDEQKQKLLDEQDNNENDEQMDVDEPEDENVKEEKDEEKVKNMLQKNLKNQDKLNEKTKITKSDQSLIKNEQLVEIGGEKILTHTVESYLESTFSTNIEALFQLRDETEKKLLEFRIESNINEEILSQESLALWQNYDILTQQYSKELCEQLRLILEPTKCSKLKGDYKTGKRLNMKRVIEYIATEYRKDKIWLRRTKPNDRTYQIMLAIDNSSSMGDNHCIQLAYESIATLINAFNYLQVGQLGLLSFGETVNILHSLQDPLNADIGVKIFSQINFKDKKTKIAHMLNCVGEAFDASTQSEPNSNALSKLLIILSDGRGVFFEGLDYVKRCVQEASQKKIFIVFIILDINGVSSSSIYDIKMPIFEENNPVPKIYSYLENFPFPFYIVLRDINNLPVIMTEALKQWFDIVTKSVT